MSSLIHYFSLIRDPQSQDTLRLRVRDHLLTHSAEIRSPNFTRCSDYDLRILFQGYDEHFFHSQLHANLVLQGATPIILRFNGRLRSSAGRTSRSIPRPPGAIQYQIEVAHHVLFENFRTPDETAVVTGNVCTDRLDALMRVFEHELVHLAEFLAFSDSSCTGARYQAASIQWFGHTAHQHALLTPRMRTLVSTDLRPGQAVRFVYEGQTYAGVINRMNKRATVLVESESGVQYSNGKRYLKFYIPLPALEPVT